MTATTTAKRPLLSGFCGYSGAHDRCPHSWAGVTCACTCHAGPTADPATSPATTTGPEAPATHVVTDPGVYVIPEDAYHRDPVPGGSLSFSGAKRLLPPSCPAHFRYEREHGRPNKPAFDFGHAAHSLVLGVGAPIVVVEADDWRTKAAKEQRDEAYAAGHVPLLRDDHRQVVGMADALRRHEVASALFNPEHGQPEMSLFWQDDDTGVTRRMRADWLPDVRPDGRMIMGDYKTCISAEPGAIGRTVATFSYYMQADWYPDGVRAVGLTDDVVFVFVFQEKTAPYLITVAELDAEALRIGRARNRRALEVYAECTANDTWPAYTDEVALISLPAWAAYQLEDA